MPDRPNDSPPAAAGEAHLTDDAPTIISKTLLTPAGAARNSFSDLLRGRKLAHFELLEPIGVGGMAAVIRARDTQLDRQVALKILPPDMAADAENVKRFENEARAAAKLDHENIARVYYCGCDQGLHFIAFEFVEGKNLRVLLQQQRQMPLGEAVHCILQIATGLVHAAERGVVHRDIKPSNIIVADNGRAKLVDMGLARNTEIRPGEALTQSGVTLGTFDYISPEQALEPREADCRSDLYSLGCTFYHMLTGVPPVPEGTAARKLQFHQNEAPLDPRQLNPAIPDELAAMLSKMMAKDPAERYQRPEFLVQHLLALARTLPGQPSHVATSEVVFIDSILPSPPRLRPGWLLLAGAAVLILLIGVLGPLLNPEPAPPRPAAANSRRPASTAAAGPSQSELPKAAQGGGRSLTAQLQEPPSPSPIMEAGTIDDLRGLAAVRQAQPIQLTGSIYDLSPPERLDRATPPPLVFANGEVTLEGKNGVPPVIRFSGAATPGSQEQPQAAVQLESGLLTLRGIRFELDARADAGIVALLAVAGGQLVLEDCEFRESAAPPAGAPDVAVLRVLRGLTAPDRAPAVFFKRCVFYGGSSAICLDEGANISLEDCLIAPYQQPVLVGTSDRSTHHLRTSIDISACSWLLGATPGLCLSSQQPCKLTLKNSIISQGTRSPGNPFLLLSSAQVASTTWTSDRNYFHNLDCLVARRTEDGIQERLIGELGEFSRFAGAFTDRGSQLSSTTPWEADDPLKRLADGDPLAATRINPSLAALRLGPNEVLGPRRLVGRLVNQDLPPREPVVAAGPPAVKELIVDGQGSAPGTYKTLGSALGDADAEAEINITIRLTGPLAVRSLEIGNRKVSIRAAEGFRPELAFNPEQVPTSDGEAVLFRLHDGELTFEQLGFRLSALREREATKLQALVSVTGTGRCRFRGCLVTLTEEAAARTCLVALADPTGAMMGSAAKPARPGVPGIELENCLVRGSGDVVTVRLSRPFQLEVKNALVALDGSLLTVDGNRPEASFAGEGALVTLERVTAYVAQSLVHVRATQSLPVQVPLRVSSATGCVFVAALGNPLLRLDGPQSEEDLKRRLSWQGRRNFYSPSSSLLLWQPLQRDEMPHKYGSERWNELWGRGDDLAGFAQSIRFAAAPPFAKLWSEVAPADFRILATDPPEPDLGSRGADLIQLPLAMPDRPAEE